MMASKHSIRYDDLKMEIVELQRKRDEINDGIKKKEQECALYYIEHEKSLSLPLVGKCYKHEDGNFFRVDRWDEEEGCLVITVYISPTASKTGKFTLPKGFFSVYQRVSSLGDVLDGDNVEITESEFDLLRKSFFDEVNI